MLAAKLGWIPGRPPVSGRDRACSSPPRARQFRRRQKLLPGARTRRSGDVGHRSVAGSTRAGHRAFPGSQGHRTSDPRALRRAPDRSAVRRRRAALPATDRSAGERRVEIAVFHLQGTSCALVGRPVRGIEGREFQRRRRAASAWCFPSSATRTSNCRAGTLAGSSSMTLSAEVAASCSRRARSAAGQPQKVAGRGLAVRQGFEPVEVFIQRAARRNGRRLRRGGADWRTEAEDVARVLDAPLAGIPGLSGPADPGLNPMESTWKSLCSISSRAAPSGTAMAFCNALAAACGSPRASNSSLADSNGAGSFGAARAASCQQRNASSVRFSSLKASAIRAQRSAGAAAPPSRRPDDSTPGGPRPCGGA